MTLDYIANINEFGENIVRLYDFDMIQSEKFRQIVKLTIITNKRNLDLSTVDFIESRNCKMVMRIADQDYGIRSNDNKKFFCDVTMETYIDMITILEPFCKKETKGHQFLYDIDTPTDFLFSPGGTW